MKPNNWDINNTVLANIIVNDFEDETIIKYRISKSATVDELKKKFLEDYDIPIHNQKWIINGYIPNDKDIIETFEDFVLCLVESCSEDINNNINIKKENKKEIKKYMEDENADWKCHKCNINYKSTKNFCTKCGNKKNAKKHGWKCEACSTFNKPLKRLCKECDSSRPNDYVVPEDYKPIDLDEIEILNREKLEETLLKEFLENEKKENEKQRLQNQLFWMNIDENSLIENTEVFECPICFIEIEPKEGVQLRNCTHQFCKECLKHHINSTNDAEIKCPSNEGYDCEFGLTDREIKALVSEEEYKKIEKRRFTIGVAAIKNSFQCKTVDCMGLCEYDDNVNFFKCYVCNHNNCLTCKAIHENQTCKQYQDDLALKALNDENARKDKEALDNMVKNGEAMLCPKCKIIIIKKDGCDWIMCSMCKTEICWATKGPRWGPNGRGDVSGGCRCNFNGQRCTPNCRNCH